MARKRKNGNLDTKNSTRRYDEARLLRHVARLNLRTKEEYKTWCVQYGFNSGLKKTDLQMQRERKKYAQTVSIARLRQHSKESKLRLQILKISKGDIKHGDLNRDILIEIFNGFKKCAAPAVLLDTLLYLERNSRLLSDVQYIQAVVGVVSHHGKWKRPLNNWRPKKHNARRQFSSLLRYLLCSYEVPVFMDGVWFSRRKTHQSWFIHIGEGGNIRTAEALPVNLTKKMAHNYLQAPDHYTVLMAFRWAQVSAMGGDTNLSDIITDTVLGRRFKDNEFWLSVIRFFVDNPLLDRAHVHPIVDYIWNEKHVDQHEYDIDGRVINTGPAQPNFTMRGRTGDSLLRQVEAWHVRLGRGSKSAPVNRWSRWIVDNYNFVEGNTAKGNGRVWRIRELLSSKELVAEGRKQSHCVASYASSCARGISAIYTMDLQDCDGEQKLLTIEVDRRHRRVCQVRGKRNRMPSHAEQLVVQRWAAENGLK